jgi:sugar diacid utilization regulator
MTALAPVRTLPGGAHVAALRAATQLAAAAGSPEFLSMVAASACRAAGVARCAVYLPSGDGRFRGHAAFPASHTEAITHIAAGGPADLLTREIVETRAPVLIRDTLTDPRAAQGALRAWKVRTVLGVPLLHGDDVTGLLYLDPANAPAMFSDAAVEAAGAIGRIAGELLGARAGFDAVCVERDALERRNRLLCGASLAERRFSQAVLEGAGIGGVVAALGQLTRQPAAFYDARRQRVAAAGAVAFPEGDVDGIVAGGSGTLDPRLDEGLRHRHLVAPVDIGSHRCGWVVVVEHNARLTAFDDLAIRRAARHVAIELAAARRATTAAWDARSLLARQLLRGTQDADVRRGAELLGIDLGVPWIVGFLRAEQAIDDQALAGELGRMVDADVLATKGPEGVAILVAVPEAAAPLVVVRRLKEALTAVCATLGLEPVAGLSAVCRDPEEIPRGYREAREVARCIDRFATAGRGVLAADDLGPGRLFVARGDSCGIERFVDDVLGPLLTGGDDGLLETLHVFFDTGRSIRASGAQLAVHENTVRYRLARVRTLTGLDVAADASDQLSVQMALLVLRLQGHHVLPGFEGTG